MKYLRKIILLCLLINSISFSQTFSKLDSIPSFRGMEWGETIDDVKSKEIANYRQTFIGFGETVISYFGKITSFEATIDYAFKDDVLTEASYNIDIENFNETFEKVKDYYINKLGEPNYWASLHPRFIGNWKGDEENGLCRGPELYWEYCNGFIGIITEKYKDDITLTVLYVHDKTILDYGKLVTFPYEVIAH